MTASRAQFIDTLRKSTWDGAGLQKPTNFSDIKPVGGSQDQGGCLNVVQLQGSTFQLEPGADPVCGTLVKGVTLQPST